MVQILLKCGKEHTITEARKIRDKREKIDDRLFKLFAFLRVAFYISLIIVMMIVFKKAGEALINYFRLG